MASPSKPVRQRLILEILREKGAQTQEALAAEMARRGAPASQITVSRDLRELGVAKVAAQGGRRYAPTAGHAPVSDESRLRRVLREFVRSIESAGQFIVIKTPPSGAQPVGLALDQSGLAEIAGTIAGDDTVFVLLRSARTAPQVLKRLQELAS